jgi:CTP:molybdopterin cytidylyltransferase MocA
VTLRVGGVLLAAGAGTRFRAAGGGAKQLARWNGRPLVEAPLAALAAAALDDRVAVLGAEAEAVLAQVDLHGVRPVRNERYEDGLATSLRAGLRALERCDGVVVVLGDGPRLSPLALERVADALRGGARFARAVYPGERYAHPVGLARAIWDQVPERGDAGARVFGEPDVLVDCSDLPAPGDVDTPDALSRCRIDSEQASTG